MTRKDKVYQYSWISSLIVTIHAHRQSQLGERLRQVMPITVASNMPSLYPSTRFLKNAR